MLLLFAQTGYGAEVESDAYHRPWVPPKPVYTEEVTEPLKATVVSSVRAPLPDSPTARQIEDSGLLTTRLQDLDGEGSRARGRMLAKFAESGGPLSPENVVLVENFARNEAIGSDKGALLREAATLAFRHGDFVKQGELLNDAWAQAKHYDRQSPESRRLADAILADWFTYLSRLGRKDELKALYDETANLELTALAAEARWKAKETLWFLYNRAEQNVFCGFTAANDICVPRGKKPIFPDVHDEREKKEFIENGLSLYELAAHSREEGGDLKVVKRVSGSEIPVPSVCHFEFGHYSAVTEKKGDFVRVVDSFLKYDGWVQRNTINKQLSGFFLVPESGELPEGFETASNEEAKSHYGRHCVHGRDDQGCNPDTGCPSAPMAAYALTLLNPGVVIKDTPISHNPSYGPGIDFTVTYNQRTRQIDNLSPQHGNFGPQWTHTYLAYIEVVTTGGPPPPQVKYVDGNGFYYPYTYNSATSTYSCTYGNLPRLEAISGGFVLKYSDGSQRRFTQANSSTGATRYYLTQIVDSFNKALTFTYDGSLRLSTITDATGGTISISYTPLAGDGVPTDTKKIRKITINGSVPRVAEFVYDSQGRLAKITDPVGIVSEFIYEGLTDYIVAMITPYGKTTFRFGELPGIDTEPGRYVEATDPLGDTERVEANDRVNFPVGGVDPNPAPCSVTVGGTSIPFQPKTDNLNYRNTYYWDKKMWRMAPGDYAKARIYNWLAFGNSITGVLASVKSPLESRVWYNYPQQPSSSAPGDIEIASKTVRLVEGPSGGPTWTMTQRDYGDRRAGQPVINPNYPEVGTTGKANNPYGKLLGTVDAEGRTIIYNYASNGIDLLTVQIKDGSNWRTLITYSNYLNHRPQTIVDASGKQTTISYTAYGRPQLITESKGGQSRQTKYTYNAAGQITKVERTGPSGSLVPIAEFTYDGANRIRTYKDADGYVRTYDYDLIDRITLITHPDGTTEQFVYDKLDLYAVKSRGGLWTRTWYDPNRRPVVVQDAGGRITMYEWCKCGDIQKIIDPLKRVTHWKRDEQGRIYEKVYPDQSKEYFSYQPLSGRLASKTNQSNQVVQYSYTLSGQLAKEDYSSADTPDVTYEYNDPAGRLRARTDGVGTTTFTYVPWDGSSAGAGEISMVNGPWADDTLVYTYDWRGEILASQVKADGGAVLRSETVHTDALDRIDSIVNDLGTFDYVYNSGNNGQRVNRISVNVGSQTLQTDYAYFPISATGGKANKLQSISNKVGSATVSSFVYDYDAEERVTQWDQTQNGVLSRFALGYNRSSELIDSIKSNSGGSVVERLSWTFDAAGNRIVNNVGSFALTAFYNELNQLQRVGGAGQTLIEGIVNEPATVKVNGHPAEVVSVPGTSDFKFSRVISVVQGNNSVEVVAADASGNTRTNAYTFTVPGVQRTFSYDARGNLENDGTRAFTWDSRNRLKSVSFGGTVYSWEYDGMDRRVVERVNGNIVKRFIWDGMTLVQERNASNQVVQNFYDRGIRIGSANFFYTLDHLESPREMIDASGTVTGRWTYDMWGNQQWISGSGYTPIGYTGHYRHDGSNGLLLAPFRAYDPVTGRWLSRDPIESVMGQIPELLPEGPNLYSYVANNPVNWVDPDGLQPGRRGGRRNNGSAWDDFKDQYDKMREANWKNSDKYFHCMANCEAAKKGHSKGAKQLSDMREWFDEHFKGDSKADCDADQEANKHGRDAGEKGEDCKSACDKYRPNGLPDKY